MPQRRLVLRRAAELFEGERNGADLALTGVSHEAKQRAGVDARGEKDTYLNVSQQMRAHAVEYRRRAPARGSSAAGAGFAAPSARIAARFAKGLGSRGPAASTHWVWPAGKARTSR